MNDITFECTNCERARAIHISSATSFYFTGECSVCKKKVVINRKRLKNVHLKAA